MNTRFLGGIALAVVVVCVAGASPSATTPVVTKSVQLEAQDYEFAKSLQDGAKFGPGRVFRAKGTSGSLVYNLWDNNGAGFDAHRLTIVNLGDSTVTIQQSGKPATIAPGSSLGLHISAAGNDGLVSYSIGSDGSPEVKNGHFLWVVR